MGLEVRGCRLLLHGATTDKCTLITLHFVYSFRANYSSRTMAPSNVLTAGIILLVTMSSDARSHVLKKPGVHHHHSASCREVSSLLESLQSGSFTACNKHPAVSKYEVEIVAD